MTDLADEDYCYAKKYIRKSKVTDSSDEDFFESDDESPARPKLREVIPVNNVLGLQEKTSELHLDFDWVERLDVSVATTDEKTPAEKAAETKAEHDFARELSFYNQALNATARGLVALEKAGIPTTRPTDYLAEMAKTDVHMQRVRKKLLSRKLAIERTEKVRQQRLQRKLGKKIQSDVLQKKQSEKKKMMTALKKAKKGKMKVEDILGNDTEKRTQRKSLNNPRNFNHRREYKDSKYGYGGQKKRSKYNTAESCSQIAENKHKVQHKRKFTKSKKSVQRRR